jgi:hypothetical protein
METRVVLALVVGLVLGIRADGRAETGPPGDNPDGGPLIAAPGSSTGAPTSPQTESGPWSPPPRSLDSKRAPVPDRLALPWDMQDVPLAPTPPIPDNGGTNQTGGGANHTSKIFKGSGGAPSDIPRDSVTRTPEDQLAPPTYPALGPR